MIHYTAEGAHLKLGLNFRFTGNGVLFVWAWYNVARHEMITHRFRLRFKRVWFMYASNRWNVVDNYLHMNDLEAVHREVLQDLKFVEECDQRQRENYAYINRA